MQFYLGICLGLQIATIEFCRNVLGMEGANSTEFDENITPRSGFHARNFQNTSWRTMRLGSRPTIWQVDDCKIRTLYGEGDSVDEDIVRYEVNPDLIEKIESQCLKYVGKDNLVKDVRSLN